MTAVGAWQLERPLGRGGMGVVWAARHRERGHPAAIKWVEIGGDTARGRFRHEVRALAALTDRRVVRVWDHGEMPALGPGWPPAGTPWFAMERLDGGSLRDAARGLGWDTLRLALVAILEGLAHAHAHGVLHLDLKPENVLRREAATDWVLADFGLARTSDDPIGPTRMGTLPYMAPELLAREPPTPAADLWATGCTAWELTTGEPPFGVTNSGVIRQRIQDGDLPAFEAVVPVPRDFTGWAQRMLAPEPFRRYATAADAVSALRRVGGPLVAPTRDPRRASFATIDLDDLDAVGSAASPPDPRDLGPEPEPMPLGVPWDHGLPRPLDPAPPGVGLLGLAPPPLVGQRELRDTLWGALDAVRSRGSPSVCVLEGALGSGRRTLARWLACRAAELGLASVVHGGRGTGSALAASFRRSLGTEGLRDPGERLSQRLGPVTGLAAIDEWLHADGSPDALVDLVAALARERPVLIGVDRPLPGVGLDALRALVDSGAPVLIVATADPDEALALPGGVRLAVRPLDPVDVRLLVSALGVEAASIPALVARCGGHPATVVALAHGALRGLGPDADEAAARLDPIDAIAGVPPEELEVLAFLGEAAPARWDDACAAAGRSPGTARLPALVRAGLVVESPEGVRIADGRTRDALLARARAEDRAGRLATAAWSALPADADPLERCALAIETGDLPRAVTAALAAVRVRAHLDPHGVLAAIVAVEELRGRAGAPVEPGTVELWGWAGWIEAEMQLGTGSEWTERALDAARAHGWPVAEGHACYNLGVGLRRVDPRAAAAWFERAAGCFRAGGDDEYPASCAMEAARALALADLAEGVARFEALLGAATVPLARRLLHGHLGVLLLEAGVVERARPHLRAADPTDGPPEPVHDHYVVRLRIHDGELDRAEVDARSLLRRVRGLRGLVGTAAHLLALVLLATGRPEEAHAHLERALDPSAEARNRWRGATRIARALAATALGDASGVELELRAGLATCVELQFHDPLLVGPLATGADRLRAEGQHAAAGWLAEAAEVHRTALARRQAAVASVPAATPDAGG